MEYKYFKTLEEVHNIYVDLWKKGFELEVRINQHYNQLYVKDVTNNIMYTNNQLNALKYSKIDMAILNTYFRGTGNKGRWNKKFLKDVHNAIKDAIRGPLYDTPKNSDYDIDTLIRNNVILPASVVNYNNIKDNPEKDKAGKYYHLYDEIYKLDENSCYYSALTQFGDIAVPDEIICVHHDMPEVFEDNQFYSFRVNLLNPRIKNHDLFPLAQPSNIEDEGIESRGRFGTELDVNVANIEAVVNVYRKGDKLINEFNYLEAKYYYDDLEFVSGYSLNLTDKYINWNTKMMKLIFETLRFVKINKDKDNSKMYATIQQLLKTTLGVSFTRLPDPTELLEIRLTVLDPFTVIQEERKLKRPRKYSNRIFITPILYTIVNEHIRNWMNVVPYRYHVKDTADAMFITAEGYWRYAHHYLDIGDRVGQFKVANGQLRSYDAKLWMLYNKDDKKIVDMAHGGITREVAEFLNTVDDWDNRNAIADKHVKRKLGLEDLFDFKRYINEIKPEGYDNKHDYSKFPIYKGQYNGKIGLLGGQGTGKTTAVVDALKHTTLNVLHLFFNKYPAEQNKFAYDIEYKHTTESKKVVRTIDSLIYSLYKTGQRGRPNYDNMRKAAINDNNKLLSYTLSFDVIVVDEIQSVNGYNRQIVLDIINNSKNAIMVGDFNQEWKKNYRNKTPFSMADIYSITDKVYKLDVNYRNSQAIFEYGKKILNDNTTSGSKDKGVTMLFRIQSEAELGERLEEYNKDKSAIIVSRHSKIRTRMWKSFGIRTYSVSDTKSTSPETVILVNSTKLGLHEKTNDDKEYEAVKEIWSAVLRPRKKLIILEYEGWR